MTYKVSCKDCDFEGPTTTLKTAEGSATAHGEMNATNGHKAEVLGDGPDGCGAAAIRNGRSARCGKIGCTEHDAENKVEL